MKFFFREVKNVKNESETNMSKNHKNRKEKKIFFQTLKNAPWPEKKSQKFRDPYKSLVPQKSVKR